MTGTSEIFSEGMKFIMLGSMIGALFIAPFIRFVAGFWPRYWWVVFALFLSSFGALILEAFFVVEGLFGSKDLDFSNFALFSIVVLLMQSLALNVFVRGADSQRISFGKAIVATFLFWMVATFAWFYLSGLG